MLAPLDNLVHAPVIVVCVVIMALKNLEGLTFYGHIAKLSTSDVSACDNGGFCVVINMWRA